MRFGDRQIWGLGTGGFGSLGTGGFGSLGQADLCFDSDNGYCNVVGGRLLWSGVALQLAILLL